MYLTAGQTDVGRFRSQNQDVFASEDIPGLGLVAIVCDGMGGAKAGDVASAQTRDVILDTLRDQSLRDGRTSIGELLRTQLVVESRVPPVQFLARAFVLHPKQREGASRGPVPSLPERMVRFLTWPAPNRRRRNPCS